MNKAAQNGPQSPQAAAQGPLKEKPLQPSAGHYKGIYRAVYEYHERHRPFPADPGGWRAAAEDMARTAAAGSGDPFLTSLLMAVYEEMERQHKATEAGEQ